MSLFQPACAAFPRRRCGALASDEGQTGGDGGGLAASGHTELAEDLRDMPFDRPRAQVEACGDFGVRQAMTKQFEDFSLARREIERPRIARRRYREYWRRWRLGLKADCERI